MMLNNVDLPQPDGPITARNSPGVTLNDTPSTAVSTPSGVVKRIETSSTTSSAFAAAACGGARSLVETTDIKRSLFSLSPLGRA